MNRIAATALIFLSTATSAVGQTAAWAALDDRQRRMVEEIVGSEYLYDGCDDTISRCLEARPTNRLAVLNADDDCSRAAAAMGRFWPFMLHADRRFDDFSAERQLEWAEVVGLDPDDFSFRLEDPVTRQAPVASKKEGLVNGVKKRRRCWPKDDDGWPTWRSKRS